jgi:hypothetical protein
MESDDQKFRLDISKSIRLFSASSRLFNSRKRIELILTRLENFPFRPTEKKIIEEKTATIRRYLSANEIGAAKHELLTLSSSLAKDLGQS